MDRQVVEVGNEGFSLRLHRGFLILENKEQGINKEVPLDNILALLLSANDVLVSKNIVNAICDNGGSIIYCGKNYVPSSVTIPYVGHWLTAPHIRAQIDCSVPLRKNLWRSIIQKKIDNQAKILEYFFPQSENVERLKMLAKTTLSDDSRNNEGQAAKIYFKALFGKSFIRDRISEDANILLNYSYTVLRAMVARAVAGNGLLPYIGLKHCTKSNALPLVDDLIEPFRPVVDKIVFETLNKLVNISDIKLTPEIKRYLITIVSYPVKIEKGVVSLSDALYNFVSSVVASFENKSVQIKYPEIEL